MQRSQFATASCWLLSRTIVLLTVISFVRCYAYHPSTIRRDFFRSQNSKNHYEAIENPRKLVSYSNHPNDDSSIHLRMLDSKIAEGLDTDKRIESRLGPGPGNDGAPGSPFIPKIPANCVNDVICDHVENYPMHEIEALRNDLEKFKVAALVERVDPTFDSRVSEESALQLCLGQNQELKSPRIANKDASDPNGWVFVVNTEDIRQALVISRCITPEKPCKTFTNGPVMLSEGYNFICKQQYVNKRLIIVSRTGKVALEYFKIPTNCCCQGTYQPGATENRFGFPYK